MQMTKRKALTPELGVIYKEVLRSLAHRGPANYLELEARTLRPALHTIMRSLRVRGLVETTGERRAGLVVYRITRQGEAAVSRETEWGQSAGRVMDRPIMRPGSNMMVSTRPGSEDYRKIPSRGW